MQNARVTSLPVGQVAWPHLRLPGLPKVSEPERVSLCYDMFSLTFCLFQYWQLLYHPIYLQTLQVPSKGFQLGSNHLWTYLMSISVQDYYLGYALSFLCLGFLSMSVLDDLGLLYGCTPYISACPLSPESRHSCMFVSHIFPKCTLGQLVVIWLTSYYWL